MKIYLENNIDKDFKEVFASFDRTLFEYLAPSEKQMELLRFDGCKKGDEVHILIKKPWKSKWISVITEESQNETEYRFVDEGKQLPFGMTYWKHEHIIRKRGEYCTIVDHIQYKTPFFIWSWILYPGLLLSFKPRNRLYKSFFDKK